jgi:phenylacetate-coenzyme A ligase PaaK-like adenylate-forming protein
MVLLEQARKQEPTLRGTRPEPAGYQVINKTPLENWIRQRLAVHAPLTSSDIAAYQLEKLKEVVAYARERSPFYRELFAGIGPMNSLADFERLPFTTPAHVREQGLRMVCTSLGEIERIVTLQTSGTTGASKRLFFTGGDLESTIDFFANGMSTMVEAGETVIIFLPGEQPDSVGDLLARGLDRIGVKAVIHGPVRDDAAARAEIMRHRGACLVGIPTQILSLACGAGSDVIPTGWVKSVLLSTDYVPAAIGERLEKRWGCRLFTHYGMTETGLGGGVECEAREGYHLREADLYTEIVDPLTGQPVADGVEGEVVFTTLTRTGMPLIRYRTGDRARMLTEPCPCGSVLRRLGPVRGRFEAAVPLGHGLSLTMPILDEALFAIDGVLNYAAEVRRFADQDQLHLCLQVSAGKEERIAREAVAMLLRKEPVAPLFRQKALVLRSITFDTAGWFTTGTGKRQIKDCRE